MTKRLFVRLLIPITAGLLEACTHNDIPEPFNCEESTLTLVIASVQGASACDAADGAIVAAASGGKSPYSFTLNSVAAQPDGNFTSLHAGLYTVSVADANQCSAAVNNVSVVAAGFTIATEVTPDDSCLEGTGTVTLHAGDGTPPYQYKLEGGDYTGDNMFSGLQEGEHAIAVRDDSNCEVFLNVTVPRADSGVSWEQDILPIIKTSCALNGCHDGLLRPDLRKYEKAHFYAAMMKELTQDRSMPFEGSIAQAEIDLIACWVDDGARRN